MGAVGHSGLRTPLILFRKTRAGPSPGARSLSSPHSHDNCTSLAVCVLMEQLGPQLELMLPVEGSAAASDGPLCQ